MKNLIPFLFSAVYLINMYDAPAYPGQVVVELCEVGRPDDCVSARAKLTDLEEPDAREALLSKLFKTIESQAK